MSEVFGPAYAGIYDSLYRDKDYDAECETIERVLQKYARQPVMRILDLGCGSGNHALPLAEKGFIVTGVDRSESMLAQARRKGIPLAERVSFVNADIRTCDLILRFDAVIMMFAVLGYQVETIDVESALATARRHLSPGGVFLFDYWHGPAVLNLKPSDRTKTVETAEGPVTRAASTKWNVRNHTCTVEFQMRGGSQDFTETHIVRYFFPSEMEILLAKSGFRLARLGRFPDVENDADDTAWNVLAVAVAQ